MAPEDRPKIDRRTYLQLAGGATVTAALAGCTTDEGEQPETDTPDGSDDTPTEVEETETESESDGFEVIVTQSQLDSGLDPQDHAETPTDNIIRQAYDGLLDRDKDGAVIEGLATEWEQLDDGSAKFTLREDVTFHNGDPLTPEDVVYSIQRIENPEVSIESGQQGDLGTPSGYEAGDGTVTFSYDGFNPIVFQLFATNGDIMQQSWVEENSNDYVNQNTNGTGPFVLENYEQGTVVEFSRNDDYWSSPSDVSSLTINMASESSTRVNRLLSDESDVVVNVPPQEINRIQNSDSARVEAVPSTRLLFLFMRYDLEPFSSVEFRQAMNYAVDLEGIIENVLNGFGAPTGQPTLEAFVGYNPDIDPYPYDPDMAEQLVEDSGHAGVEIELQTPIGRYLKDVEIAQAAANQINELPNVSCTLKQREFASLVQDMLTGNIEDKPPFSLLGWGNGEFDASQTIAPLLSTDGPLSTYSDEEVDDLLAQAADEPDEDARVEILQEANQLLHDRAPWVFLNQQFSVYGVSEGVDWTPRNDEAIDVYTMSPQ